MTPDEPRPSENQLPAEKPQADQTWEVVLSRASQQSEAEAQTTPAPESSATKWSLWARAAIPLVIILIYVGYKISGIERAPGAAPEISQTDSLSGVRTEPERIRIDRETEELLVQLDALFRSRNWPAIQERINKAPEEQRKHPVVEAFNAIARVFQGEVSGENRATIRRLLPRFENDSRRVQLYDYLLLADATMELRATASAEDAIRNADYFRQTIRRQSSITPEIVSFRTKLAERYEQVADSRMKEAGGFRTDKALVSEARSLYQHALRWVTLPEGWMELRPISAGQPATVRDRIVVKLKEANEKFNGFMLPVKSNDNSTWTSRAGDPVHDRPGGTW